MAKLYVVAGHGGSDPGAGGNGYYEAERVRALANEMKKQGGDNVILGDTSIDWYSTRKFATLPNPGCPVIELHLDSATASAKGGHVILKSGFAPDKWDNALVNYIRDVFPGRSSNPDYRDNLQNVNLCASRGINYRLLEVCFISNAGDMNYFNSHISEIAKNILKCFDINGKAEDTKPKRNRSIVLQSYDGSDSQKWWVRDNDYYFALRNSSCYEWLSDPNSSKERTNAMTYEGTPNGTMNDDPREPQLLTFDSNRVSAVKISPKVAPNLCLSRDGDTVIWEPENDYARQDWLIYKEPSGAYRIANALDFKMLTCPNGGWY